VKIPNPIVNARKNYVQKECRVIRLKILSSFAFLGDLSVLFKLEIMQNANDWRTEDKLSTKKRNHFEPILNHQSVLHSDLAVKVAFTIE